MPFQNAKMQSGSPGNCSNCEKGLRVTADLLENQQNEKNSIVVRTSSTARGIQSSVNSTPYLNFMW